MDDFQRIHFDTKKKLDSVSKTMCLAKWTQTTIHLGLGHTHSCHHPRTHKIPIEEIKKDPSALHNTSYKKSLRKEMLSGDRPAECDYCWKVEDLNDNDTFSDRIFKSATDWSMPFFDEILKVKDIDNINPRYLEISFSNVCNFKCSYCMPAVSSQWMEEIQRHGYYPTSSRYNNLDWPRKQDKMPILSKDENPYIDAFWIWFPSIYTELHTFRITGGEPLLDKNTFKVLDYVLENPNPNLEFSINSNFDVPLELFEKFIDKVKKIEERNCVKQFVVHTSCEAKGKQAEYIRFGLNYNRWINNLETYIESLEFPRIGIMSTYNCLSVISYKDFLNDVLLLKKKLKSSKKEGFLSLDIPYLNNPSHMVLKILTEDFLRYIDEQIEFVEKNSNLDEFSKEELYKLKRVRSLFYSSISDNTFDHSLNRKDFIAFVDEHDKRRGTNFLEIFPLYKDFYYFCKNL